MTLRIPWRARPGAGFVLLTLAIFTAGAFLAWGMRTPKLESFWKLQVELEVGERGPLSHDELALVQEVLWAHPEIADEVIADSPTGLLSAADTNRVDVNYAHLVRRSADGRMALRARLARGSRRHDDVTIHARVAGNELPPKVAADGAFEWTLPSNAHFPQLIELTVDGKRRVPLTVEWVEAHR